MDELVRLFSEKRTFNLCLFAGIWTGVLASAAGFAYTAFNICMTVFVVMMLISGFMCMKSVGVAGFFSDRRFSLFESVTVLRWLAAMIVLGMYPGNEEVRGIVANMAACVLVIGLAIIALFPNKRVLPG